MAVLSQRLWSRTSSQLEFKRPLQAVQCVQLCAIVFNCVQLSTIALCSCVHCTAQVCSFYCVSVCNCAQFKCNLVHCTVQICASVCTHSQSSLVRNQSALTVTTSTDARWDIIHPILNKELCFY